MFSIINKIREKIRKNREKSMYEKRIVELNKLNYKDYLLQGKKVKLKDNLLENEFILFNIAAKVKVDRDRNIEDVPVIIGEFKIVTGSIKDKYRLGCWDAVSGKLICNITDDGTGIITRDRASECLSQFLDLVKTEIIEVEDLTDEYLDTIDYNAINLMYLWLGNVYTSITDCRYKGMLALNLKEE